MKQTLTSRAKIIRAARTLLRRRKGWRQELAPHRKALRMLRVGRTMRTACQKTGISRQTIWRMLKNKQWPKKPGGVRQGRCKIPPDLVPKIMTRMRLYKQDREPKPIGASIVNWLSKYHGIHVTPAAIYSLRSRAKAKRRKQRAKTRAKA
ncbi:MAG: helix-turn-helix domain-containing protein [Opitutaceae bacterium]|nr:helix-turn-helix domain-containing protein [Opitutaceae bacterium]